jgi:integrase/recombinase XerD
MTRQNHILHNPASEIDLPRLGRSLPKNILSAEEVERVMTLCAIEEPIGLRDRALLEVLYSTGMRRLEIVRLKLYDLSLDRGLLLVNQGKGSKDRYVPIGARARLWLEKYIREGRPQLVSEPDDFTVFLTAQGEPFSRDHLTFAVKERIDAAQLGKTGSCHLFRHTMATLMHEGGADIRHIQAILGHEDIRTTQIYTQVAIRALQQIHAATHPAEAHATLTAAQRSAAEREGLLAALEADAKADEEAGE